ncbi:MAG: TIGR02186 family protein [Sphingobium sp.]
MARIGRLFLPPLLLLTLGAADSPRLVPDVSQRQIDIQYSFKGAELLLFGAIAYPDGRIPKKPADIVIVLKGPEKRVLIREKQKIAGIWVNADSMRFQSVPSFYAIASSRPIRQITDDRTAAIYELSIDNIQLSPTSFTDAAEIARFEKGLIDLQQRTGLFVQRADTVEISDGLLYRVRLPLSSRVVVGDYTAETFLIQDGRVVAAAVRDIQIRKSGFERFVANAAEHWSLLYGLTATLVAVAMGMVAGWIGRRI